MKDWKIIMGGYNWGLKRAVSGLFRKMMQAVILEESRDVVCWPQKNVKNDVNES